MGDFLHGIGDDGQRSAELVGDMGEEVGTVSDELLLFPHLAVEPDALLCVAVDIAE